MKLYIYDHCPYCVRARMIFGLKKLAVELVILQNHDEKPIELVGRKAVPIFDNGAGLIMPESLDIVRYVDKHYGTPILKDHIRPEIEQWLEKVAYSKYLLLPRFVKLDLAEHQTEAGLQYFLEKKQQQIGNFDELFARSLEFIAPLTEDLKQLETLLVSPNASNGELSMEDIVLFPILRNLSCVKGLNFPAKVEEYLRNMAQQAQINLYFDKAL